MLGRSRLADDAAGGKDVADVDLFGRPVFDPIKGEQLPLFHEPVQIERPSADDPTDARIRRKFASAPTGNLFPPAPRQPKPRRQ